MTTENASPDPVFVEVTCFWNGTRSSGGTMPPDCNGAVNNTYFVEFLNGSFAIHNKEDGSLVTRVSDAEFWEKAGLPADDSLADPRLVFIPNAGLHGQWFALQLLNMGKEVYVATTDPQDPQADPGLGKWRGAQFPLPGADFPMLGYDTYAIYIGSNTASEEKRQPQLVTIPRAKALAYPPRVDADDIKVTKLLPSADYGENLFPVINGGGGAPGLALGVDTQSKKHVTYAFISPQSGEITAHGRIEVKPFEPIPEGFAVKQPYASSFPHCMSNTRFFITGSVSAPIRHGSDIWMTHTVLRLDIHSLAVRWYRLSIDPHSTLPVLMAAGEISDPHYDYFNSAILSFGKDDYTVLSLCRSGDSTTPSDPIYPQCGNIAACAALALETPAGPAQVLLVRNGQENNYMPPRWGDYSTICKDPDPALPRRVWAFNQYVLKGGDNTSLWCMANAYFDVPLPGV